MTGNVVKMKKKKKSFEEAPRRAFRADAAPYVGLPWPVWTHHRKLIVAGRMPRTVRRFSAELRM